jgi:hypothetical protein
VHLRSILGRRPSAPLAISLVALFMSVGGVGYAAISLPANSVGTDQIRDEAVTYKKIRPNTVGAVRLADNGVTNSKLRNGSVSYKKIQPRAVGTVRANLDQLQARLASTCPAGSAIGAVDKTGKVTCNLPAQTGVADKAATTLTATAATVNSLTLPAGASYLVFANPSVTAVGAARVTCTLTVGTTTQSRTVTLPVNGDTATVALQAAGAAGPASVSCTADSGSATAATAINALAVSG